MENESTTVGDPTQFMHVETPEPHRSRTKSLIKAHPEVRKLIGRNIWSAALGAGIVLGQCGIAFALGHAPYSYWPAALAIAWGLGAFANHALYVLIHEGTHDLVFRGRFSNKAFVIFCDLPNLLPGAIAFRHYHLRHHSHPGTLGVDADLASPWEVRLIGRRMVSKVLWLFAFPIFQALRPLQVETAGLIEPWLVANIAANAAFVVAAWFVVGPLGVAYLLASFWFSVGLHPLGARWTALYAAGEIPEAEIPDDGENGIGDLLTASPMHRAIAGSTAYKQMMYRDPRFLRYRLMLNYTYLHLSRLGVPGLTRYLLCHLAANAVEEVYGVSALQLVLATVAAEPMSL